MALRQGQSLCRRLYQTRNNVQLTGYGPTTVHPGADAVTSANNCTVLPSGPPMYHTETPRMASLCQIKSGTPSRFISAAPLTDQPVAEGVISAIACIAFPSGPPIYQTETARVASLCQIKSGTPSRFISAAPLTDQPVAERVISAIACIAFPSGPPIYQTETARVASLCQIKSGTPSRFISAAARTVQPVADAVMSAMPMSMTPSGPPIYHTETARVASLCQIKSGTPSRFISAIARTVHPGAEAVISATDCKALPSDPLIYQTVTPRVASFCQTKSGIPLRSKSNVALAGRAPVMRDKNALDDPLLSGCIGLLVGNVIDAVWPPTKTRPAVSIAMLFTTSDAGPPR